MKELAPIHPVPGSLSEALDGIEADRDFPIKGEVGSYDIIRAYIKYKHENGNNPLKMRQYPAAFFHYYNRMP